MSHEETSGEAPVTLRDHLALERTHLANERTLLAYGRAALMLAASGVTLLKLETGNPIDRPLAGILLVAATIMSLVGAYRFYRVRRGQVLRSQP